MLFMKRARDLVSGALSLTGKMPSLGRAQQPSHQCTTLGTTPERIKESVMVLQGKKQGCF